MNGFHADQGNALVCVPIAKAPIGIGLISFAGGNSLTPNRKRLAREQNPEGMMASNSRLLKQRNAEVDAYVLTKENLKRLG